MIQSKNHLPGQNQEDKDSSVMQSSHPLVNYAACLYFPQYRSTTGRITLLI